MQESAAELEALQALLDDSIDRATPFLRSSFEMPEHSLSAAELVGRLDGRLVVSLATVTAGGEPRVAPIGAMFVHGCFWVPTVLESARARHVARRPGVSLTYYEGVECAVIVHGQGEVVGVGDRRFGEVDSLLVGLGGQSPREWSGTAVYLRVVGERVYTYAR